MKTLIKNHALELIYAAFIFSMIVIFYYTR
jgi:hypothetical protein